MTHNQALNTSILGDRAEILELYRPESFRLALRITGNPTTAEDVVQSAYLRLFQAPKIPALIPELMRYIRRTVTNCAIDHLRLQHPQSELNENLPNTENPVLDLEINQTLNQLSPEHRAILALHLGEGYSYKEIADTLSLPMGTVASRLNQARTEFKKIWEAK
jgi:RNA polymerase sigma-70 factor, ECF subfamily